MKIAIIISGEYRTFPLCRKTMQFIDDLANDIFVSVWDKSIQQNTQLGVNITEEITVEKIKKDINRDIVSIEIENIDAVMNKIGTHNRQCWMCYRWVKGLELVKKTNIIYDYICILRPDLFFNTSVNRQPLIKAALNWNKNIFYCNSSPAAAPEEVNLNDFIFLASPDILFNLITEDIGNEYIKILGRELGGTNWHNWWFNKVKSMCDIERIPAELNTSILGRPVPNVLTWDLSEMYDKIWLYSQLIDHVNKHGMEKSIKFWDKTLLETAIKKMNKLVKL